MAADGFTIAQYIDLLRIWHDEITKKEKLLMNGFRVYQTLFFLTTALLNSANVISTFITSIMIGLATTDDPTAMIVLSSIATALGIVIGILGAINFVFKPQFTAGSSAVASKQYGGLAKELIIEIKSYEVMFSGMTQEEVSRFSVPNVGVHSKSYPAVVDQLGDINYDVYDGDINDDNKNNMRVDRYIDFETYKNRLLYYSTREQLISITEPGLLLIGYMGNKTVFDRTYVSSMPVEDLETISKFIDAMESSSDKRRLKKIIAKAYLRQGQMLEKN